MAQQRRPELPAISSLDDSVEQTRETIRRFPEVREINDDDIREATIHALSRLDTDYFWHAPATQSNSYHNPYCRMPHGLWMHTKMVFTAYERLVDSHCKQNRLSATEADQGRAAILLHDYRKYGDQYTDGDKSTSDHDVVMADLVRSDTDLGEPVAAAIASHMGPWYDGPTPETPLQQLVHQADMMGSAKNGTFGLYEPADELQSKYPALPTASF